MVKAGTPPRWLKPVNRVLTALQRTGLGATWLHVLVLPGRRTGKLRQTPVTPVEWNGARYLVAGFPGADWARNARAAGVGILRQGRTHERVRLVELSADEARPVLREFPVRVPTSVSIMVDSGVVPDGSPEAFAALAGRCAVFRVERTEQ
jgi:hypothetical protein